MRLYHFTTAEHGLDDIKRRRLKIATFPDLNDPFELHAVRGHHRLLRDSQRIIKDAVGRYFGMLCFSTAWSNPVQWSHYAKKHTGLCLGFDVTDDSATQVQYVRSRIKEKEGEVLGWSMETREDFAKVFSTKYSHWRYESEWRVFVPLEEGDPQKRLYFHPFSEALALKEVIVGAESDVTRAQIADALKGYEQPVKVTNARLAFRSFRVVTQQKKALWT